MINDPNAPARARKPRAKLVVNGKDIYLITAEIKRNNYYHADSFEATIPLYGPNAETEDWWLSQGAPFKVEIHTGEEQDDGSVPWQLLQKFVVDKVKIIWNEGIIELNGRDETAFFIDNKIREAYQNKSASEIVNILCAKRGLTPVITTTTDLVGTFYAQDHVKIHLDQNSKTQTEWDLITYLAQKSGYDAWVDGDKLYFQPKTSYSQDPWVINRPTPSFQNGYANYAQSNVLTFCAEHQLNASKDIKVAVRTWHSKKGRGFQAVAGAAKGKAATSDNTSSYVFVIPNLTDQQAQDKANQFYADLTVHEYIIEWSEPADVRLTCRNKIQILGQTGVLAQDFYVDEITMTISFDGGFIMSVRAKNHPEASQEQGSAV